MTGPGNILIIDDDAAFVGLYREILENEGLAVTTAGSTPEAIAVLESRRADLDVVLLDPRLQGAGDPDSGLELVAEIGRLAPFAKTIVVTGYATAAAIERAFSSASTTTSRRTAPSRRCCGPRSGTRWRSRARSARSR